MRKLEIERKFLIKMPDEALLKKSGDIRILKISQTYTTEGSRIRRVEEVGKITYIKTVKKHISDLVRLETEEEITLQEYEALLKLKQPDTITLNKTRYVYPYKNKNIEIDIFPFWQKQAFCEVELESEKDTFELPEFIEVIREITSDKAFRNYALSKNIPKEENF